MKIILHGKLAELCGKEFHIQAMRACDAIEGLSRQLDNWPRNMVIEAVGFDTEEKLRAVTDAKELHLVPAMAGGGAFGKIVLGVALIAAAIFIPGGWAIGGVALSTVALSIGISLVLSGIMQLFMKAPKMNSKEEEVAASKYLGVDKNTTAIGTYRGLGAGRFLAAGHWLSLQVDSKTLVKGRFPASL